MFRKALITTLAISAVAASPAGARPSDAVTIANTADNPVPVAGTVGIDPAANGVQVTNTAPIPVAPVAAETRAFTTKVELGDGDSNGTGPVVLPGMFGSGLRFQSTFIYANAVVNDGVGVVLSYITKIDGELRPHALPIQPNDLPGPLTQWVAALPAGTIADEAFFQFQRAGDLTGPDTARIDVYGSLFPRPASS